jgi:hypothetical protein
MQNDNLYVKKPISIQAYDFLKTKTDAEGNSLTDGKEDGKYYIDTLEGKHYVRPDDFIIIGVRGERYPCKRDIFFATYEKVRSKNDEKMINFFAG